MDTTKSEHVPVEVETETSRVEANPAQLGNESNETEHFDDARQSSLLDQSVIKTDNKEDDKQQDFDHSGHNESQQKCQSEESSGEALFATKIPVESETLSTSNVNSINSDSVVKEEHNMEHEGLFEPPLKRQKVDDKELAEQTQKVCDVEPIEGTQKLGDVEPIEQTQKICDVELIEGTEHAETDTSTLNDGTTISTAEEGMTESQSNESCALLENQFKDEPRQVTGAWKCYQSDTLNNYLRGCKWAPDGTCLLTNSNDNTLRVFNLPQELYYDGGERKIIPELMPVLTMKEADTVYDFCWFPLMSSLNPDTACLAVTSKDTPVHLYDAFTGDLRCSYRAYNHVDEVVAAHCVEFNPDGTKLYCGFNKMVRVFDVTRPGREFTNRPTFAKEGQRGIISCIAHSPTESGLYATGSYAKSVALYSEPAGEMVCMFEGQQGGVTQVKFSPDGSKLYSGGRKDNEILCWDMRNPGQILFTLQRDVLTNQRMYFDITGNSRYIVSGSHNGTVYVWDSLATPITDAAMSDPVIHPTVSFKAHGDTVNGVSLHKTLPLLATTSGQRHYQAVYDSDDDTDCNNTTHDMQPDNSLRLWWT